MTTFARFVCLFTLACWVGGILFFGGVEARALFHHLPRRDAGVVVAASLHSLHRGGILAGAVLLLCLLLFPAMLRARVRVTAIALAAVMLAATAGLNYMITYKMEPLRASAPAKTFPRCRTTTLCGRTLTRCMRGPPGWRAVFCLPELACCSVLPLRLAAFGDRQ